MGRIRAGAGAGVLALVFATAPTAQAAPPRAAAAGAAVLTGGGTAPGGAVLDASVVGGVVETAAGRASSAKAEVEALLDRYQRAEQRVDAGVAELSRAFSLAAAAEVTTGEAEGQARRARERQALDVRAVYASGGPAGLTASVLTAGTPDDALWRASTADRIMATLLRDNQTAAQQQAADATLQRNRLALAEQAISTQGDALRKLRADAGQAGAALTQAQQRLATLDAAAKRLKAAREAAQALAAARAAAAAARAKAMGPVTAIGIPAAFETAYRNAAKTCPGLPWTLLAAVGQVESGHGRNNGPSSAGAIGPMQFLPRTFDAYAVDGDGDGVTDPWDPEDAVFTAARYLCQMGADGGSAAGIHAALLAYNHAEWYVQLVLAAQQSITAAVEAG